VQSEGTFHLPLSTGEIVSVDILSGRILARSPMSEETNAGNMIALGDRLIMATPLELVGLSSADRSGRADRGRAGLGSLVA
jgi:hypothetical protein